MNVSLLVKLKYDGCKVFCLSTKSWKPLIYKKTKNIID